MHQIKGGASWERFGKGWGARVADLRSTSKLLADGKIAAVPHTVDQQNPAGMGKATHIDPKARKTVVKSTAGGTVVAAGGTHTYAHDFLLRLGIAVGVIVVGGFAYYELVRSQGKNQNLVVLPPSSDAVVLKPPV